MTLENMRVPGFEPTTILSGGRGQPTLVVRDHDGWRAQVEAEKRREQDERIKARVAQIERDDAARAMAGPAFPGGEAEMISAIRARGALHRERMEAPRRVAAELDVTEALIGAMAAAEPPPPDPVRQRWERQNAYSHGLAEWLAEHRGR